MNGDLRDILVAVNDVALAGVKAGQEIGEREAATKVRPLIEALQWCVDHDGECLGDYPERLRRARAALAAYGPTAA